MTCSMVSMNSLEQISLIIGVPPFFTHILVSFQGRQLGIWIIGHIERILFFIQRTESWEFTLLDLNTSEISNAMGRSRSPLGMLSH
ncbi:CPS_collapsed_G0049140.mRNA.1.CDS.1 [Saccharomyces cerevisiae]|nr:CPS_collapsed_G0049140.mRNA.1.CDS.1 [Saccharomyces cerevisiae]